MAEKQMELPFELWKDVVGFEGWYQVSSFGRVKRLKKVHCNHGKRNIVEREYVLKPIKDYKGYFVVYITNGVERKNLKVHRLVAEAFIPNPNRKKQVDHINRIRTDNRVENLRWATSKENARNSNHQTMIDAFGETKGISEWAEEFGLKKETVIARLQRGWNNEDAVSIKPLKEGEYLNGRKTNRT